MFVIKKIINFNITDKIYFYRKTKVNIKESEKIIKGIRNKHATLNSGYLYGNQNRFRKSQTGYNSNISLDIPDKKNKISKIELKFK